MYFNTIGGGSSAPYEIEKSLRFRKDASANLQKAFSGIGYTQATVSFSCKRSTFGLSTAIVGSYNGAGDLFDIYFTSGNLIGIYEVTGGSTDYGYVFNNAYRDPSAHMHVVVVIDTPNPISTDRLRCYVNGVRLTSIFQNNGEFPQNYSVKFFRSGYTNYIGYNQDQGAYFDGYLSEFNFIDGLALDAASFGEFDVNTEQWVLKKYSGMYGANGFYLDFKSNSNLTDLCSDKSGNGNNWTAYGVSLTSGATYDSMLDTPTNNFATLNPIYNANAVYSLTPVFSSGGLLATGSASSAQYYSMATIQLQPGKYHAEFTLTNGFGDATYCGLSNPVLSATCLYASSGNYFNGSAWVSFGASYTTGDTITVEFDSANSQVEFFKNGVSQGTKPTSAINMHFFASSYSNASSHSWTANFGQRQFSHTPTSGFKSLCVKNLPAPTITVPKTHFDVISYVGDDAGTTRQFSGVGFAPDLVWAKSRNVVNNHSLFDSIRGAGANSDLSTNLTGIEGSSNNDQYGYISSFNSDGFTATQGSSGWGYFNQASNSEICWLWKAGGAAVTNTSGSITSQVSANPSAGFSIVTYTGNGVNGATIGHGLGVVPKLIIVKCRNNSGYNWYVYHASLGSTACGFLDTNLAFQSVPTAWNNTEPTASVFSVGNNGAVGANAFTYVAYCIADVPGYSKVYNYVGNGSADGAFVYCGFKPRYIMVKCSSSGGSGYDWILYDSERNKFNTVNIDLNANTSSTETNYFLIDILANGFKLRNTYATTNASGGSYIFYAVAETPFQFANAR